MVRLTIGIFIILLLGAGGFIADRHFELGIGEKVSRWGTAVSDRTKRFLNDKEVEISGTKFLSGDDVKRLLPLDRSVPWWLFNRPVIEATLTSSPLIMKAGIERCGAFTWSCFRVLIEERDPAFFAIVGERALLAGPDGVVIRLVSPRKLKEYLADSAGADMQGGAYLSLAKKLRIPVVSGIFVEEDSADMVRGKFARLRKALDVIEQGSGYRVGAVELIENEEIKVRFFDLPFTATFELPVEGSQESTEAELFDRGRRLKQLVAEFGSRVGAVDTMDLTFERIAVVRPLATPTITPVPRAGKAGKGAVSVPGGKNHPTF